VKASAKVRPAAAWICAVAIATVLTGCGGPDVTYKPSGTYTSKPSYPVPPIPTAEQLDKQFRDAVDSTIPDEERLKLIQKGELFEGDLPSFNDARSKNPNAIYRIADPVFDNGDGTITATFKLDKDGTGRVVHSIPVHFIAIDGIWKLSREDLCGILTSNDYTTKAC
jgi:hypothetical protein